MPAVPSFLSAPAVAYGLWFLLGSLWTVLFCEYRAFRKRARMVAHIHLLEAELMRAEDNFLSERTQNDCVRAELLDLLAVAREHRPSSMRQQEAAE